MIAGGVMLLMHGRTLPTWKEEEEQGRNDSFLYEFFNGPAGYNRSRGIVGGFALIAGGLFMLIAALIKQFP